MIENGAQSQPEKRSLQALDSASKPFISIKVESLILIKQLKRKVFNILSHCDYINFNQPLLSDAVKSSLGRKSEKVDLHPVKEDDFKEESISSLIIRFSSNQDLLRIIITLITTIYLMKI